MKKPSVVIDADRQELVCTRCGESVPIPLGVIPWVVAVGKAFEAALRRCQPGERREEPLCRLSGISLPAEEPRQ